MKKLKPLNNSRITAGNISNLVDPDKVERIGYATSGCQLFNEFGRISLNLESGNHIVWEHKWKAKHEEVERYFLRDLSRNNLYFANAKGEPLEISGDLYQLVKSSNKC